MLAMSRRVIFSSSVSTGAVTAGFVTVVEGAVGGVSTVPGVGFGLSEPVTEFVDKSVGTVCTGVEATDSDGASDATDSAFGASGSLTGSEASALIGPSVITDPQFL